MRAPRLFIDMALAQGERIAVPADQAHYLKHVLRCTPGQAIVLFNGRGGEYSAQVLVVGKRDVEVEVLDWTGFDRESSLHTVVALGVTKRDAMDLSIQKCTELGATYMQPLVTRFTAVPHKSIEKRQSHWQQVAYSAAEQCERNLPPRIGELLALKDWLPTTQADLKVVLHPGENPGFAGLDTDRPGSVALLIGPEGGLADEEVKAAEAHGFVQMSLGPRILRAETAPLALLALLQARWGDLG